MNNRTSGFIIAISAAVAGAVTPSTVDAYLGGRYVIATGLGVIVALNAGIAMLHIFDRGDRASAAESATVTSIRKPAPLVMPARAGNTASISSVSSKRHRNTPETSKSENPAAESTATPSSA